MPGQVVCMYPEAGSLARQALQACQYITAVPDLGLCLPAPACLPSSQFCLQLARPVWPLLLAHCSICCLLLTCPYLPFVVSAACCLPAQRGPYCLMLACSLRRPADCQTEHGSLLF